MTIISSEVRSLLRPCLDCGIYSYCMFLTYNYYLFTATEAISLGARVHGLPHIKHQEYISSKSVQLLQTAFLHIDVTSASVNPISGGTSRTYVNHSLHRSFRQTNHTQPVPFKGPDSVVDS